MIHRKGTVLPAAEHVHEFQVHHLGLVLLGKREEVIGRHRNTSRKVSAPVQMIGAASGEEIPPTGEGRSITDLEENGSGPANLSSLCRLRRGPRARFFPRPYCSGGL